MRTYFITQISLKRIVINNVREKLKFQPSFENYSAKQKGRRF